MPRKSSKSKSSKTKSRKKRGRKKAGYLQLIPKGKDFQDGLSPQKDIKRPARPPGKRRSATGNIYYEYRVNRSDYHWDNPNDPWKYRVITKGRKIVAIERTRRKKGTKRKRYLKVVVEDGKAKVRSPYKKKEKKKSDGKKKRRRRRKRKGKTEAIVVPVFTKR